jgi:hypothetical protein
VVRSLQVLDHRLGQGTHTRKTVLTRRTEVISDPGVSGGAG